MPLGPDLECSWWPDIWFGHSLTHCCIAHDLGGTDWQLAVCVAQVSPWLVPVAVMMLVGVMFGRPIYRKITGR